MAPEDLATLQHLASLDPALIVVVVLFIGVGLSAMCAVVIAAVEAMAEWL